MTMTRYLFDAGPDGADLTTTNTGTSQVAKGSGAAAVFAAAYASAGGFGAKFTANNTTSLVRVLGDAANPQYAFSGVFWTPDVAQASGEFTIWSARHSGGVIMRLRIDTQARVFVTDSVSTYNPTAAAAFKVAWGTKYRLEVVMTAGSTTAGAYSLKIYDASDTLVGTIAASNANLTANPVVGFDCGNHGSIATLQVVAWDTIQMDSGRTSEIGKYVPGANNPPTVSAGANQSVAAGSTVNLTSTATDSDGAIASRQWTVDGYPAGTTAPTITNATSAQASFTAAAAGVYVLRHTATDNGGASASSTMKVFVPTSSVTVIAVTENSGAYTSPTNVLTALSDGDASTYVDSPASPSTEKTLTMRLAPLNPLSPATFEVQGLLTYGSGNLTAKARLLEGTTTRKEWTLTLTGSAATASLTLSAAECATIGSWSELDLQIAVAAA